MPRMFGTDGVRGLANRALTAQLALDLGDAAVRVLGDDGDKSEFDGRRRALVGRDTRVSGDFLAAALSAGMSAGGFDVIDAGIIPTPGVAYLTSVLNVEMGAVISASHNPMPDNGIKFFARGGFKLPDTKEDEIESVLGQDWERPTGAGVGRISHDTATATNLYIDHLVSTIAPIGPDKSQPTPLKGLKVVADCANGATSVVAPEALRRAGADVIVINASPDATTSTRTPDPHTPNSCRPWSRLPAPIWVWPSTVTPTVASPWTKTAPWSTAIKSWAFSHAPRRTRASSTTTPSW